MVANFSALIIGNIAIWVWTLQVFGGRPELLGTALLAYVFGLRHAFDPDHIAAIDNVVRKLMQDRKPATLTGFYFALGHSSIVMLASIAVSGTALSVPIDAIGDFSLIRTGVSAFFLFAIGLANYFILRSIWAAFSGVNRGDRLTDEHLESLLSTQGPLNRVPRATASASSPRLRRRVCFLVGNSPPYFPRSSGTTPRRPTLPHVTAGRLE